MSEQIFLTTRDLAKRWGVTEQTIRHRVCMHAAPKRVDPPSGKRRVFLLSDVEAFEKEHGLCPGFTKVTLFCSRVRISRMRFRILVFLKILPRPVKFGKSLYYSDESREEAKRIIKEMRKNKTLTKVGIHDEKNVQLSCE